MKKIIIIRITIRWFWRRFSLRENETFREKEYYLKNGDINKGSSYGIGKVIILIKGKDP